MGWLNGGGGHSVENEWRSSPPGCCESPVTAGIGDKEGSYCVHGILIPQMSMLGHSYPSLISHSRIPCVLSGESRDSSLSVRSVGLVTWVASLKRGKNDNSSRIYAEVPLWGLETSSLG